MTLNEIKEGTRVRLKAVELAEEETGTVVSVDAFQTICVKLDEDYIDGIFDDGLRDITADQILEIIK